jgi:hypothetical protein
MGSSGDACKGRRRSSRGLGSAPLGRRRMGVARFRRGAAGGGALEVAGGAVSVHGRCSGRGSRGEARGRLSLALYRGADPEEPRARTPRRGGGRRGGLGLWPKVRWASPGLAGWSGSGLRARPDRIGFVFFRIYF